MGELKFFNATVGITDLIGCSTLAASLPTEEYILKVIAPFKQACKNAVKNCQAEERVEGYKFTLPKGDEFVFVLPISDKPNIVGNDVILVAWEIIAQLKVE